MPTPSTYSRDIFIFDRDVAKPSETPAGPFTSDTSGDPRDLARESNDSQNAFAELQQFLNNNLETPGTRVVHDRSKPWRPPSGAEGE